MISDLITRKELAKILRVTSVTIYRWEKKGMPVVYLAYRTKRYRLGQVMEWFSRNEKNEKT